MVARLMSNASPHLPDHPALVLVIAALQAENVKMSATLQAYDQLIQSLRRRIAKLKKQVLGKSLRKCGFNAKGNTGETACEFHNKAYLTQKCSTQS
ncbi:hypothetical protein B5K06_27190 [Rhizobium grahamii]|uniref:Transposase n=1 Tax=Rhizobium grahamii TaxID=1120045 RepID=A0A370KHC1_9HYPH|nr:hypothetical protein B5K06_27190 [Rhizobium grahamii]